MGAIDKVSEDPFKDKPLGKLTPRERDVLNLLANGKSVKAIARILGISSHTVSSYLKGIYFKLDVHSKNEAIYRAITLLNVNV